MNKLIQDDDGYCLDLNVGKDKIVVSYDAGYTPPYIGNPALKLKNTGNCLSVKIPSYNTSKAKKFNLDYDEAFYLYKALESFYKGNLHDH